MSLSNNNGDTVFDFVVKRKYNDMIKLLKTQYPKFFNQLYPEIDLISEKGILTFLILLFLQL